MCLHAARLPGRTDDAGGLLLLVEQDRQLWDQAGIWRGLRHLAESSQGDRVTRYHLEAGIAACHALAPEYAATNWRQIVELYDQLLELDDSPVVALSTALVAVAQLYGPRAGLRALDEIKNRAVLERYHLLPAVAGQLWLETGEMERARECFLRARGLAALPAEHALLEKKLGECSR